MREEDREDDVWKRTCPLRSPSDFWEPNLCEWERMEQNRHLSDRFSVEGVLGQVGPIGAVLIENLFLNG